MDCKIRSSSRSWQELIQVKIWVSYIGHELRHLKYIYTSRILARNSKKKKYGVECVHLDLVYVYMSEWGSEYLKGERGIQWVKEWVSEWEGEWMGGWLSEFVSEWVSEYVSELECEWFSLNEWVDEWVREWVSGWVWSSNAIKFFCS